MRRSILALAVAGLCVTAGLSGQAGRASAASTQKYNLTSLGSLGGGYAFGLAINGSNHITGDSITTAGYEDAFIWKNKKMTDLGPGVGESINGKDQVAGIVPDAWGFVHAALWANGQFQGELPGFGGPASGALGINANGIIAGWSDVNQKPSIGCGGDVCHGFTYKSGGSPPMKDLGGLNGRSTAGEGINKAGTVAGWAVSGKSVSGYPGYVQDAAVWAKGKWSVLPQIGNAASGLRINTGGEIAGFTLTQKADSSDASCGVSGSIPTFEGALWSGGKLTTLAPLSGHPDAEATAINDKGLIGGASGTQCFYRAATLWKNGKAIDLSSLAPKISGQSLDIVDGITNSGAIVATAGDASGRPHAYLLTPCSGSSCKTSIAHSKVVHLTHVRGTRGWRVQADLSVPRLVFGATKHSS